MKATIRHIERQIAASITEVIINEMLYNADMKDRISSSSIIHMPDWYIKGLDTVMFHTDGIMKLKTG